MAKKIHIRPQFISFYFIFFIFLPLFSDGPARAPPKPVRISLHPSLFHTIPRDHHHLHHHHQLIDDRPSKLHRSSRPS